MHKPPDPEILQCGSLAIPYTIYYSDRRKTLVIEISPDLSVIVRAPQKAYTSLHSDPS